MDASARHVPGVAKRFNASATPTRKRTTAPDARRMEEYSRIAACPVSLDRTGHGRWRSWKRFPDPPQRRTSPKSSGERGHDRDRRLVVAVTVNGPWCEWAVARGP